MRILKMFPVLMVIYEVSTYLSNDMYLPALPQMSHDLHMTEYLAQLTLTTWLLGTASVQLIFGPLSERYGRKPIFLLGGVLFVITTIMCATAINPITLLIARFLQGCAVCSVVVTGYATVHELYEHKEAIRILAWLGSITILAPAFGPLLGSFILQIANWRFIFWLLAICSTISLLPLLKWMPESNPKKQRGIFSIEKSLKDYVAILKNKIFILNTLAFCLPFGSMMAWITIGPFLSMDSFHYTPLMFGIFQIIVFGSFIIISRFIKYGLDLFGTSKLISIGLLIASGGAVLSVLLSLFFPDQFIFFVCAVSIFTGGTALIFGPLQRIAIDACQEPMGSRMAIFSSIMSWFGVFGSIAASIFYNGKSSALGYILLIAAILACLIRWQFRQRIKN